MTETRETYTIGNLTLVETKSRDIPTDQLLEEWFRLTETGLIQLRQDTPPQDILELLGYRLASDLDELRWQIGDWAVLMASHYGLEAYERLVVVCGLNHKATAVEDWAYICRGVSQPVRCPDLSIYYHRLVVPLRDPAKQGEWLGRCVEEGWSISRFEAELRKAGEKEPEAEKPYYPSDREYELMLEAEAERKARYEAQDRLAEVENELSEARSKLDQYADGLPAPEVARGQVREVVRVLREFASTLELVEIVKDPAKWVRTVRALLESVATDLEELEA